MTRALATIGSALAILAIAAAFSAPAGATVPKPDFIAQADGVCARMQPRLFAAIDEIARSRGFQSLSRNTERAVKLLKTQVDRMQQIGRPDRGRGTLAKWYRLQHAARRAFHQAAVAARHRDVQGVNEAVDDALKVGRASNRAARSFGFRVCR